MKRFFGRHPISFSQLVSSLGCRESFKVILKNTFSLDHYYFLKANLKSVEMPGKRRFPYRLERMGRSDISELGKMVSFLNQRDRKELIVRLLFHEKGFKNGYIARTRCGDISYIQWLIYDHENGVICRHYRRRFYTLNKGDVMLENAFTFPKYRGFGLLASVSHDLIQIAKSEGCSNAVSYVRKDKIESLETFIKLGFKIQKLIPEFKMLGTTSRILR